MPKISYIDKKFNCTTLDIIDQANIIIFEYQAQGFDLTLRQLYYQFVARDILPNTEQSYNRLGTIISNARRGGLIDWDAIVDRTRHLRKRPSWTKPRDIIKSARDSYHNDLWLTQPGRVEVWIEKDALTGVIASVCDEYDVPYFSCRGYVSDSEMWRGAIRMYDHYSRSDQPTTVFHLGDHDPSGLDMSRDIKERLDLFSGYTRGLLTLTRIALNMDQINELNPPPNPAKITDSRYYNYEAIYGKESWELDALEPRYIQDLVKTSILSKLVMPAWRMAIKRQEEGRDVIAKLLRGLR